MTVVDERMSPKLPFCHLENNAAGKKIYSFIMLIFRRPQSDKKQNASICTISEKLNTQMIL